MIAPERNIVVKIDLENKEKYKFASGIEIILVKGFNFNRREDSPSIGTIIDGDNLPHGALCLVHHNSTHDTFKIPNVIDEKGHLLEDLYSISTDMVFCFKEEGKNWQPTKEFLITLRLYREYTGVLLGIEPKQIPQMLYVVCGKVGDKDLSGKVVITSKFSDYEVIFNENGRETSLVRTRVREVMGINTELTKEVKDGKILIGNNLETAKHLK
ncbi:MAG: hypothetical protein ABI208_06805 [Ginsengibacter sp.]